MFGSRGYTNKKSSKTGRFRKILNLLGLSSSLKKQQYYFLEFDYYDDQNCEQSFFSEGVLDYESIKSMFAKPFVNWQSVRLGEMVIPQNKQIALKVYESEHNMSQIIDEYKKKTGLCPGTGQWSILEVMGIFKDISQTLIKDCSLSDNS